MLGYGLIILFVNLSLIKDHLCINNSSDIKFGTHITFMMWMIITFFNVFTSCQQLLTADDSENQPKELKFGKYITFKV